MFSRCSTISMVAWATSFVSSLSANLVIAMVSPASSSPLLALPAEIRVQIYQHLLKSSDIMIGTPSHSDLPARYCGVPRPYSEPHGCRLHYVNQQLEHEFLHEATRPENSNGKLHIYVNKFTISTKWIAGEEQIEQKPVLTLPSILQTHCTDTVTLDLAGYSSSFPPFTMPSPLSLLPSLPRVKEVRIVDRELRSTGIIPRLEIDAGPTMAAILDAMPAASTIWFHETWVSAEGMEGLVECAFR